MKDKDIIQALSICVDPERECRECNLYRNPECSRQARTWAVFRLEELKKENKRLKKENKRLRNGRM